MLESRKTWQASSELVLPLPRVGQVKSPSFSTHLISGEHSHSLKITLSGLRASSFFAFNFVRISTTILSTLRNILLVVVVVVIFVVVVVRFVVVVVVVVELPPAQVNVMLTFIQSQSIPVWM